MLRRAFDWLFVRDLESRRARVRGESKALAPRIEDLAGRSRQIEEELHYMRGMVDKNRSRAEQSIPAAEAGDERALEEIDALIHSADRQTKALATEADALQADLRNVEADQERISDALGDIDATATKRVERVVQGGIVISLVTVAVGLLAPGDRKAAEAVHLEYYAAVAGITPVLFVAGLVEIALLRVPSGAWTVLSFVIPGIGATGAALDELATHSSTPATLYLTVWGLVVTTVFLSVYFVMHASSPAKSPITASVGTS